MSGHWTSSNRRAQLPHNWAAIRAAVIKRAGKQCEWIGTPILDDTHDGNNPAEPSTNHPGTTPNHRCTNHGSDVDHRNHPDDHSIQGLQLLCVGHHKLKTQAEAQAAADAQRELLTHPSQRMRHPGLTG